MVVGSQNRIYAADKELLKRVALKLISPILTKTGQGVSLSGVGGELLADSDGQRAHA